MTTQTVKGALAKRESVAMAQINSYRSDFATMLPSHLGAAAWVRGAQGLLRKDVKLRRAADQNPGSFLAALLDCARWGLEPGVTYHFIPFGGEIVGVRDYKGIIELIYRAGAVSSVKAEVVYSNDVFDYDQKSKEPPTHEPAAAEGERSNWFAPRDVRGEMVGAYSYAIMKDGSVSQVVIMADWELAEHEAASKTSHLPDSMWKKWRRSAYKKTVARELEKWVPSSPEWITHKVRAERLGEQPERQLSAAALALPPPIIDDEVLDGEVIAPEPPSAPEPTPAVERQQRPPEADAATQPANQSQMRRIFVLLKKRGIGEDGRLAAASMALERDIGSFKDLTADDASRLTVRLEQADQQPPPDDIPADQPVQPIGTEGDK